MDGWKLAYHLKTGPDILKNVQDGIKDWNYQVHHKQMMGQEAQERLLQQEDSALLCDFTHITFFTVVLRITSVILYL